jgi:hypothetical protein
MAIFEPGKPVPVWVYGAGAGVLFIGYTLYRNSRNKAAATAVAPKPAAATATTTPVVPASSYGTGQNAGSLSNIEQQLQALNSRAVTQGAASSSGVSSADNQQFVGSGYYPKGDTQAAHSTPISSNGHTYQWVPNPDAAAALGGFNNLYLQPVPGLFVKNAPGTPVVGGTPLFAQVS